MTELIAIILAFLSFALWVGLLLFRGGFWKADQRLPEVVVEGDVVWPRVTAVIPARNEAGTIAETVHSLLSQDYGGQFDVIVVDDNSGDGTGEIARRAARGSQRVRVITGKPLAKGWSGKLWAVSQGLAEAEKMKDVKYVLLTDADIRHDRQNLTRLVAMAETEKLNLVSLMVRLRCKSFWERLLIPAFVFFFQKLYPFPWINDPERRTAGAAGGCMLVHFNALKKAGGMEAIKDKVIDDCALGALLKEKGKIWLGLAGRTESIRPYDGLGEIRRMVARSAYDQLDHSFVKLVGTVVGMLILYVMPPLAVVWGLLEMEPLLINPGVAAYAMMVGAYAPTSQLYPRPFWYLLLLPMSAALFTIMTLESAVQHWRGRGAMWKGRHYAKKTT